MFFNYDRYYHAWGGIPNRVDLVQKCSPEYPCICKAKDDQHYQPESSYQGTTGSTPNLPTELPGLSFGWNCDVSAGLKAVTNEHSSLRTVDVTSLQINDACTTPRTVSFGGLVTDMNDGVSFYKTWELELPEGNGEYEIEIKAEYHKFPGCVLENYALGEVGNPKVVRRLVLDGRLTLTGHSVDCRPLIWMKLHKVSVANRTLAPILYPSSSNIVWEQEMLLPNATVGDVIINAPTFPEKENDKKVIRPDHSMPVCAMGFLYDQDYCMPARHGGTFTSPNQGFIVSLSDEPCAGHPNTCAASVKHVCQHVRATSMCLANTESTTREDICPIRVDCGGVQARYVRVTLPGDHRILFLPMDGVALYKTAPTNAKVGDYAAYVLEVPPTQLTYPEYTISEDPKDPVFYSTCYTYTLGKRWRPAGQNGVELAPANWHFNGRCLDCETYLDNQRRHNDTSPESRTVKWTMSPSCRDCRQTKPLNFSTVNETFVWAIDGTGAPSPVGETVTCGPGFYESGGAGNDLGCTACVNQANCAASTANQCSTSSGFTRKTPCASVTAAGYYLDGDVVKVCATVSDSSARTCTAGGASGIQSVACDSGFHESGSAGNNLGCTACASVTGGTCTACSTGSSSACTALVCHANKVNTDGDATNGCEVSENHNSTVVITPVTTQNEAENSINNLNAAAEDTGGSEESPTMTKGELEKQYEQRKNVLNFLDESTMDNEVKTELLERVTASSTTLDVVGAEIAMNVSGTILSDLLDLSNTTSSSSEDPIVTEKRRNATQKVGGVVSNIVLALNHVGNVVSNDVDTTSGSNNKDEGFTNAVKEVYKTIDLLSDVQLVGAKVNTPPVVLTTPSFELLSQRSSKVGLDIIQFNAPSSASTIVVPIDLGPNFLNSQRRQLDGTASITDLSMTSWSVNLHDSETAIVQGPAFKISLLGVTMDQFDASNSTVRALFLHSLKKSLINSKTTKLQTNDVDVRIIRVLDLSKSKNTMINRLRRLVRRALYQATIERGIAVEFAVDAPGMNIETIIESLDVHLSTNSFSDELSTDSERRIFTSKKIENSSVLNTTPDGAITGFKIKQNGKEIKIQNSAWFLLSRNWTEDELDKRKNRSTMVDYDLDAPRANRTIAICNSTNVGAVWNVKCHIGSSNTAADIVHLTDLVNATTVSNTDLLHAEARATCPSWYASTNNLFLIVAVVVFVWGCLRHLIWKLEDGIWGNTTNKHRYNDWVRLYMLSGFISTISLSIVASVCSEFSTSTVVDIHVALILATIATGCLTIITFGLLFFLSPKSYVGCFPSSNKNKLYAHKHQVRAFYNQKQKKFLLHGTPRTKKRRNSTFHKKGKSGQVHDTGTAVEKQSEKVELTVEHVNVTHAKRNGKRKSIYGMVMAVEEKFEEKFEEKLENVEEVVEKITHAKKKSTDYVSESAGPMEIYARWHRNWPWLLFLLCCLLLPASWTTLHVLSTKGIDITGETMEAARDRPLLDPEEQNRIIREEETFPSMKVILKRVEHAQIYTNNLLACEEKDQYALIMECPISLPPEPTPDDDECLYWDTSLRLWSSQGCELVSSTIEKTVCRCNHLTDFGTALDSSVKVWGRVFEEPDMVELFVLHW